MTAFLFIPAATGKSITRQVDFTRYASLFAECEEPVAAPKSGAFGQRVLGLLLVLAIAIGDTVLLARPGALIHMPSAPAAAGAPVTSL